MVETEPTDGTAANVSEAEKKARTTAKRKFTQERKNLNKLIEQKEYIEILTNSFSKLNDLWVKVQNAHETYLQTMKL